MSEQKVIKCPWCGQEMRERHEQYSACAAAWYEFPGCGSKSPVVGKLIGEWAIEAAYLAATATPLVDENTSDGYHTFKELYHHRAVLFAALIAQMPQKAWKSKTHSDGTVWDGWFIVGIETPGGMATYHYAVEPYWDMFCCQERERAPEWDGHTPEQAINRIALLITTPPNLPLTREQLGEMDDDAAVYLVHGVDLDFAYAVDCGPVKIVNDLINRNPSYYSSDKCFFFDASRGTPTPADIEAARKEREANA